MWTPRPILGSWTPDQQRVAEQFPARRRVACVAANGVGKTYLAADIVASFIADMPAARIILTAPTNRQVNELLWPHVTQRLLMLGLADEEWVIPTKPKWSGGDNDTLIGFATNSPQRMQGFHAANLLIVMDEASGFPQTLVEALEGIATAEHNYILAIGNPNEAEGAFYSMTRLPSWHTETISALTHPNIVNHTETIPGATTWLSMCDRIRDWCKEADEQTDETFTIEISDRELMLGPDEVRHPRTFLPNDAFRVRYLGRFPSAVAWSLIDRSHINIAIDNHLPGDRPRIAALDVARTGGDRTMYGLRHGDSVVRMRTIQPGELMHQAEEVAQILIHDDPEKIVVDAAGIGWGLVDRLRQLTNVPVIAFQGAEEPTSPLQCKKYFNRRSAAYAHLQEAFEERRISIPPDPDLADELAAVTYRHTPDGKLQMEDKQKVAVKLGRSPDAADMLSLLWESGTDFSFAPAAVATPMREVTQW